MNNDSLKDDSQLPEQQGSGDRRPGLQTSCDWLAKQLVLTPRDLGSRMALGLALGDLGDHEGARNQFELADGTKPDNVRILVNLAMSCLQCGRTVGFEAALSRALACAGDDTELQRLLARMNLQSGSVAAARQGFERLLQHTPTDPDALTGLAKCYLAAGDPENASAVMGRLVGQASESSGSGSFWDLVVARYREDLWWLERVPAERKFIYNKGTPLPGTIPLPNVGREAETFLHHIVQQYEDLADCTTFVQGNPLDHAPTFLSVRPDPAGLLSHASGAQFLDVNGYVLGGPWHGRPGIDGKTRPTPVAQLYRQLYESPPPPYFYFYCGAQFTVPRSLIQRHPRAFYQRALTISRQDDELAYAFEAVWLWIFGGPEFKPPPLPEGVSAPRVSSPGPVAS